MSVLDCLQGHPTLCQRGFLLLQTSLQLVALTYQFSSEVQGPV